MNTSQIEEKLVSEIKLSPLHAKTFLLITCFGKMNASQIAEKLSISKEKAIQTARDLMELGAFIDISETEFEAMHPRFTAVNMYRRFCEREKIEFKRKRDALRSKIDRGRNTVSKPKLKPVTLDIGINENTKI